MALLGLLFALGVALAQGAWAGVVIDPDVGPMAEVDVTLTSPSLDTPRYALTDPNGAFLFDDLAPGTYTATEDISGWQAQRIIGISLRAEDLVVRTTDVIQLVNPGIVQTLGIPATPCVWAAGIAANATPAGRGWDLGTSGPVATSVSPVLSRQCTIGRLWASIDLAPWLRHTYGGGQRASLALVGSAGYRIPLGVVQAVPFLATQGATWGTGIRLSMPVGPVTVETRLAVFSGKNPDLQSWLLLSPKRQSGKVSRALSSGLALGTFVGYDRTLYKWFGLRAGLLTSPLSNTVLQPTVLADATVRVYNNLSVTPAAGASWRGGGVQPLGGLRVEWQRAVRMHAGVLYGPGTGGVPAPDVGVTMGW